MGKHGDFPWGKMVIFHGETMVISRGKMIIYPDFNPPMDRLKGTFLKRTALDISMGTSLVSGEDFPNQSIEIRISRKFEGEQKHENGD